MTRTKIQPGDIFGKLTIINSVRAIYNNKYRLIHNCKCKCGKVKQVIESNIYRTKTCGSKSCKISPPGRISKKIGQRKGRLLIISTCSKQSSSGRKNTYYKCQCDCGKIIETQLTTGNSCGCLQKENLIERSKKQLGWASTTAIWNYYKKNAKTRNLEWNLTREEFTKLIQQKCFYCNIDASDLWQTLSGDSLIRSGIDRVNNTLGYKIDNCVSCCKICNRAKGSLDVITFNNWIERLKNR